MYKSVLGLIVVVFLLSSCHKKDKKQLEETLNVYLSGLMAFDKDLIDHFPLEFYSDEIKDFHFTLQSIVKKGGCSIALLRITPDTNRFNEILLNTKNNYKKIDLKEDKNLIILPDSSNLQSVASPIFIPNFDKVTESEENIGNESNNDYHIYIINAKPGNYAYASEELKGKPYLPMDWEHGFSRGIGIDTINQNIIFWLIIW